jgi:hypothetical protein
VGVLPDNLNIPTAPVLLPKLALYIRVVFPLPKVPSKISAHLQAPWQNEPVKLAEISPEQLATAIDQARVQDSDAVRFNFKIIASPFNVLNAGKIAAITSIDNTNILAGILSFRIQQPST